jgi:acyl-coenzyme A synthetase/AMP-(fatty) acid ligase
LSELTLSRLLAVERDPGRTVAWRTGPGGADHEVRWSDFQARVGALARRVAALPRGRVALYTADSYAFAVGLFAIWHSGRLAVCPPNGQPGTLAALSDMVIAAVSDGPGPVPGRPLLAVDDERRAAPGVRGFAPLPTDAVVAELFTSGTTGRGKAVAKTLAHLEREVQGLEARFGPVVAGAPALGSASHQHLYGMLFRVLWPLAAGRPFHARPLLHAEELLSRVHALGPCVLASVPAHLKRLAGREEFATLARGCRVVFSSGGPLDAGTAERWERTVGEAPFEIFGSTETGGIAWRQQGRGRKGEPWTPFAGVRVRQDEDGRLRVYSPTVSLGDEGEGFALGDRVRLLPDGRFVALGRADRVLKIGEKRLSLPDMEERLLEHPWVEAVALLSLPQRGELRVAAAVVLAERGRAALQARGRRAVGVELAAALSREWDRVLLPRAWRFVEALPEDAQGKLTQRGLRELFETRRGTSARGSGS